MGQNSEYPIRSQRLEIRCQPELKKMLDYLREKSFYKGLTDADIIHSAIKEISVFHVDNLLDPHYDIIYSNLYSKKDN